MKRFFVSILLIFLTFGLTQASDVRVTNWTQMPIYSNKAACVSTTLQFSKGADTAMDSVVSDVKWGYAKLVPAGTKYTILKKDGKVSTIIVEKYPGVWYTFSIALVKW